MGKERSGVPRGEAGVGGGGAGGRSVAVPDPAPAPAAGMAVESLEGFLGGGVGRSSVSVSEEEERDSSSQESAIGLDFCFGLEVVEEEDIWREERGEERSIVVDGGFMVNIGDSFEEVVEADCYLVQMLRTPLLSSGLCGKDFRRGAKLSFK